MLNCMCYYVIIILLLNTVFFKDIQNHSVIYIKKMSISIVTTTSSTGKTNVGT